MPKTKHTHTKKKRGGFDLAALSAAAMLYLHYASYESERARERERETWGLAAASEILPDSGI